MSKLTEYVNELARALNKLPFIGMQDAIDVMAVAKANHNKIFVFGNGGSASTASHFVCDLVKNVRGICAISLTDNPYFSAYSNDNGYWNALELILANLCCTNKDIVIAISASGNSKNVINAVKFANCIGATTIGITGYAGGELGEIVKLHLNVPCDIIEQVEDAHLAMCHMMAKEINNV